MKIGAGSVGGLVGNDSSSTYFNCSSQDTIVNLTLINGSFAGGIVGKSASGNLIECHNFGFSSNANKTIVQGVTGCSGSMNIGGIVGCCSPCSMSKCGVHGGKNLGPYCFFIVEKN